MKNNGKLSSQSTSSNTIYRSIILCIFYEVIMNYYPSFLTYIYFPLALFSYVIELFRSEKIFKEKVDSDNN